MTLIYFVLILGIIILVHEFGHFIFAKKFGVYVYEFAIGMGPKIWSKKDKKGETEYSIRAIPIGGFVSLAGEDATIEDKKLKKDRYLHKKPIWQRFLIMVFGAMNNFILAFVFFFVSALVSGAINMDPLIFDVTKDKPAERAGLLSGDYVVAVNGNKTKTIDDVQLYIVLADKSKDITFEVKKESGTVEYKFAPDKKKVDGKTNYIYGLEFKSKTERGFLKSIEFAYKKFGATIRQMKVVLTKLFTGQLSLSNLSGPIGIFGIVGSVSQHGIASLLMLTAVLSINVGFINLIPFPAFDGGRIVFLIIEKIRGKAVDPKIENLVNTAGFIFLLILTVIIMISDVFRLVT